MGSWIHEENGIFCSWMFQQNVQNKKEFILCIEFNCMQTGQE